MKVAIPEAPNSDFGPQTFVARLRDYKIPYTFPFNLKGYTTSKEQAIYEEKTTTSSS